MNDNDTGRSWHALTAEEVVSALASTSSLSRLVLKKARLRLEKMADGERQKAISSRRSECFPADYESAPAGLITTSV